MCVPLPGLFAGNYVSSNFFLDFLITQKRILLFVEFCFEFKQCTRNGGTPVEVVAQLLFQFQTDSVHARYFFLFLPGVFLIHQKTVI
jgi:hypothetical protein